MDRTKILSPAVEARGFPERSQGSFRKPLFSFFSLSASFNFSFPSLFSSFLASFRLSLSISVYIHLFIYFSPLRRKLMVSNRFMKKI